MARRALWEVLRVIGTDAKQTRASKDKAVGDATQARRADVDQYPQRRLVIELSWIFKNKNGAQGRN